MLEDLLLYEVKLAQHYCAKHRELPRFSIPSLIPISCVSMNEAGDLASCAVLAPG